MNRYLLVLLIVLQTAAFASFVLPQHAVPIIFLILVALVFGILGCRALSASGTRAEREGMSFTSVVLAPLVLVLLTVCVNRVRIQLLPSVDSRISSFLLAPMLSAYYLVPSVIGMLYLSISAILVALAWNFAHRLLWHKVLLTVYTSTLLCYAGYVLWWYMTEQEYGFL